MGRCGVTKILDDESTFVRDSLEGFVALYPDHVRPVDGGVVRAAPIADGAVAVVVGGGSGHYPGFAGVVGTGMAAGAVCGNIFTSPSAGQAFRVAAEAENGGGVLFSYGNYAGDVLHFGEAEDRLRAQGIDARTVLVTDDIASAPIDRIDQRRGIAGDFVVFKIAGAAAERGMPMDEVERLAREANFRTRTLGVAFAGCTFPGATEPLFTVPEGMMSIGLGIHGEPGIRDVPLASASELAAQLVEPLLEDVPTDRGDRAVVVVNGLGTVKYEEMFVLYRAVARLLDEAGVTIVQPESGEFVTSLDMAGVSLTLFWLTPELEELWSDPADTPAYRKGRLGATPAQQPRSERKSARISETAAARPEASDASKARAERAVPVLRRVQQMLHERADELGRIDAVAGDGDHGVGMRNGIDAAVEAADAARDQGLTGALLAAGDAWSERSGGTSGALWGAAIASVAPLLDTDGDLSPAVAAAARAALDRIVERGKAKVGDKTMVDALQPFVERLEAELGSGAPLDRAFRAAADAATQAAADTASLTPKLGRARPLAERSIGTPDAGATSLALVLTTLANELEGATP
jgi:dihydroxyacetone kinase